MVHGEIGVDENVAESVLGSLGADGVDIAPADEGDRELLAVLALPFGDSGHEQRARAAGRAREHEKQRPRGLEEGVEPNAIAVDGVEREGRRIGAGRQAELGHILRLVELEPCYTEAMLDGLKTHEHAAVAAQHVDDRHTRERDCRDDGEREGGESPRYGVEPARPRDRARPRLVASRDDHDECQPRVQLSEAVAVGRLAACHHPGDRGAERNQQDKCSHRRMPARRGGQEQYCDRDLRDRETEPDEACKRIRHAEARRCVAGALPVEQLRCARESEDAAHNEHRQDHPARTTCHACLLSWTQNTLERGSLAHAPESLPTALLWAAPIRGLALANAPHGTR